MPWNEEKAVYAAEDFRIMVDNPPDEWRPAIEWIRQQWAEHYLICGHKMLGRVMLGKATRPDRSRKFSVEDY